MTKTSINTIQIFEYQTIRIGEKVNGICFDESTYKALAIYQEKQRIKYFSLVYNGVKFSHYVGVIQVGNLTIEILPKADKSDSKDTGKWQKVLLEMLRYCRLLKVESFGYGQVQLSSNAILDLYFEKFITDVNQLFINGLPKKYIPKERNKKVLKGRLNIPKQLRKNGLHPERFYVKHITFDYDHLFNRVLFEALKILEKIQLKSSLQLQLKQLLAVFPKLPTYRVNPRDFDQLFQIKKYQPHQELLEISRLILFNFSPDVRSGRHHLFALLFDMNKLYEEYVFRQLKRLENDTIKVQRQTAKPFWQRRTIRPDLLLQLGDKKYVLDTKWKVLKTSSPSIEDLKQLYIYCQYFGADNGVLLYPDVHAVSTASAIPFQPTEISQKKIKGQVLFVEILDVDGNLNKDLGGKILAKLT